MNFRLLILSFLLLTLPDQYAFAQSGCPGCLLELTCPANLPNGGICDSVLPTGMTNNSYDENVSFYMPANFVDAGTGYNIILHRIEITGINGLPVGLNWQANATGGIYQPDQGDTLGCIKICGTPITSGVFDVTVFITADVTATNTPIGSVDATETQTYITGITILADTAGGVASFSFTPQISSACDSLTLTFDALVNSPTNPTTWDWNFGNGQTGTNQSGGTHHYDTPGTYPVSLTTTIFAYKITGVTVTDVNANYAGNEIEELTTLQNPDLYFLIPNVGYTSSVGSNSTTETWNNLSLIIPIGTDSIDLEIWDQDIGPPFGSPDDFLGEATIPMQIGTWAWTAGNGTYGIITIGQEVETVLTDTLMVTVNAHPIPPMLTTSSDTVCLGDSITLSIDSVPHFVRWYQDSVEIPGTNGYEYTTLTSGYFQAALTDVNGCSSISDSVYVLVAPIPFNPTFGVTGNRLETQITNFDFQWFKDSVAIPGATMNYYDVTEAGLYQLMIINPHGCSAVSNLFYFEPVGVEEFFLIKQVLVYPNPARNYFNISFVLHQPQQIEIEVLNMMGERLFNKTTELYSGQHFETIDIGTFPVGIYHVIIRTQNEELHRKILKQ